MSAFSLPPAPAVLAGQPSLLAERSPTAACKHATQSFGAELSPVELSAQARLTSELLRTL
jgi:hypothetical protein